MMMDQISKDSLKAEINLIGAAIGNGCWGTTVGTCAHGVEQQEYASAFYFGQGMYAQTLRTEMLEACGDWSSLNDQCSAKLDEMNEQMGDFDVYNVYDECGEDNRRKLGEKKKMSLLEVSKSMARSEVTVSTSDSFSVSAGYSTTLNDYECGGHTAMNAYLTESTVIDAIHVKSDTVGMTYTKTCGDLLPLYNELIAKYQILIYSGDTDGCVPYVGTEQWTQSLNYTLIDDWHQWFAKPSYEQHEVKAGYAVTYDKFQFITINGVSYI